MTLRRSVMAALIAVVLAVGVAQAGWFYQSGRWFYTPDIGTEITYKGVPVPGGTDKPPQVVWTLTTTRYGCACQNNGGQFASEVVSLEAVDLTVVDDIEAADFIDKNKGIAKGTGHIVTDGLCTPELVTCQNSTWNPVPDSALVFTFTATAEAFAYNKKTGQYEPVAGSKQNYDCELSDFAATPLNPPAPNTPYNCE